MNTLCSRLAIGCIALGLAAAASAQSGALTTANSCLLVTALDTGGRIDFRDGSYVTRKPGPDGKAFVQEQFNSQGRLRYTAEVARDKGVDTVLIFDPATGGKQVHIVRRDGFTAHGKYKCYEMDGRAFEEGEKYPTGPGDDRVTSYRRMSSDRRLLVEGRFVNGKDSTGTWKINDESGRPLEEINFSDGQRQGKYTRFTVDGQVDREGQYFRNPGRDTILVFDPDTYQTVTQIVSLGSSPCGTWKVREPSGAMREEEFAPCIE